MKKELIYLASDHAGHAFKEKIKKFLLDNNIYFEDLGPKSDNSPVDYPDYAKKVVKKIKYKKNSRGILICGSGTGMCIAANRNKGIRAVAAYDLYSAKMSRLDNDSNILCLRGRSFPFYKTKKIISVWLRTNFSGASRHIIRIGKLDK